MRGHNLPATPHCGRQRVILANISKPYPLMEWFLHFADNTSANTTSAANSMLAISENVACSGCVWT